MHERTALVERSTLETVIRVKLNLDGQGLLTTQDGEGFFNHLLAALCKYALWDLDLAQKGDLHVDQHHLVEDIGLCLGQALRQALGDRAKIRRFGWSMVPMDEALVQASVDLAGRSTMAMDYEPTADRVGQFDVRLVREFMDAFAQRAGMALHLVFQRGYNDHHVLEAAFKALGWALRDAVSLDPRRSGVPSTKGCLD